MSFVCWLCILSADSWKLVELNAPSSAPLLSAMPCALPLLNFNWGDIMLEARVWVWGMGDPVTPTMGISY